LSKDIARVLWVLAIIVLLTPALINVLFLNTLVIIPTAEGLGNREWLSFWASYMGGILGIVATLIAFSFTARQNSLQHKQMQTELKEQERLRLMPCADVICSKAAMPSEHYSEHCILLTGGGGGAYHFLLNEPGNVRERIVDLLLHNQDDQSDIYAVNVVIRNLGGVMRAIAVTNTMMKEPAQLSGIITGQSLELCVIHQVDEMSECKFRIEFDDIQGRRYFQTFSYFLTFSQNFAEHVTCQKSFEI